MSEPNPRESDLILGGQNPPPINAAVLGGLAGVKQRLESESIAARLQALNDIVQYGENAIDPLIQSLSSSDNKIRQLGHELLAEFSRSNNLIIVKKIASNHNTPPDILAHIGKIESMEKMLAANIQGWSKIQHKVKLNPSHLGGYFGCHHVNLEINHQQLIDFGISAEIVEIVKIAYEIYQCIAMNPSSPIQLLLRLSHLFPKDSVNNPVLSHLMAENSKFIDEDYSTQIAIAQHPDTSLDALQYLLDFGRPGLSKNIAIHPNISLETLEEITNRVLECDTIANEASIGIAKNPKTPAYILEKLAVYRDKIIVHSALLEKETEDIKYRLGQAILKKSNTVDLLSTTPNKS